MIVTACKGKASAWYVCAFMHIV